QNLAPSLRETVSMTLRVLSQQAEAQMSLLPLVTRSQVRAEHTYCLAIVKPVDTEVKKLCGRFLQRLPAGPTSDVYDYWRVISKAVLGAKTSSGSSYCQEKSFKWGRLLRLDTFELFFNFSSTPDQEAAVFTGEGEALVNGVAKLIHNILGTTDVRYSSRLQKVVRSECQNSESITIASKSPTDITATPAGTQCPKAQPQQNQRNVKTVGGSFNRPDIICSQENSETNFIRGRTDWRKFAPKPAHLDRPLLGCVRQRIIQHFRNNFEIRVWCWLFSLDLLHLRDETYTKMYRLIWLQSYWNGTVVLMMRIGWKLFVKAVRVCQVSFGYRYDRQILLLPEKLCYRLEIMMMHAYPLNAG
ncbi:hypothetical protein CLF_113279, partial [Clonorchis sinensis]